MPEKKDDSLREEREHGRREEAASTSPGDHSSPDPQHTVLPPLRIAQDLLPRLDRYVSEFFRAHGEGVEVGGMLVGEFSRQREMPAFTLNGLIEAGPSAEFSADSILFDSDYQLEVLQAIRERHPHVGNMGCIHFHPGQMDECSAGDFVADLAAVRESDTKALIFGIITQHNPRQQPGCLCFGPFKFDFFLLAEQTRFEYVRLQPVLEPLPLVDGDAPATRRPVPPGSSSEGVRFSQHHAWCSGLLEDKKRLVAEVRAMEERYGDRAVLRYAKNQLFWEYTVTESGRRFPVEVRYPRRYPLEPPRIISRLPLPSSPHQLVNNELCWINRAVGDWNPARDTAATCIHAAHRWFACLLVYLTLGKWPEEANDEPVRTL